MALAASLTGGWRSELLLAFDGAGAAHHHVDDPRAALSGATGDSDRVDVKPRLSCPLLSCPLRSAIVAPLPVQDRRIGSLVALHDRPGRIRLESVPRRHSPRRGPVASSGGVGGPVGGHRRARRNGRSTVARAASRSTLRGGAG
jgi:hypothetical protein